MWQEITSSPSTNATNFENGRGGKWGASATQKRIAGSTWAFTAHTQAATTRLIPCPKIFLSFSYFAHSATWQISVFTCTLSPWEAKSVCVFFCDDDQGIRRSATDSQCWEVHDEVLGVAFARNGNVEETMPAQPSSGAGPNLGRTWILPDWCPITPSTRTQWQSCQTRIPTPELRLQNSLSHFLLTATLRFRVVTSLLKRLNQFHVHACFPTVETSDQLKQNLSLPRLVFELKFHVSFQIPSCGKK